MITLKLGDVVPISGGSWVVGSVTVDAAGQAFAWQLLLVPAGKLPTDLGKTWTRDETETLYVSQPATLSTTTALEPPLAPPAPPPPAA